MAETTAGQHDWRAHAHNVRYTARKLAQQLRFLRDEVEDLEEAADITSEFSIGGRHTGRDWSGVTPGDVPTAPYTLGVESIRAYFDGLEEGLAALIRFAQKVRYIERPGHPSSPDLPFPFSEGTLPE